MKLLTTPLLVVGMVVDIFLLVNGQLLFGSIWASYQSVLVLYLLMDGVLLTFANKIPTLKIETSIIFFIPIFIMTTIVVGSFVIPPAGMTLSYVVLVLVFQIFVVALTEEMMFRGVLLQYMGVIPQAVLFGIFHLTAYYSVFGLDVGAVMVAMAMGLLFGYIVKYYPRYGIVVAWAIHAGWNVSLALGIFGLGRLI